MSFDTASFDRSSARTRTTPAISLARGTSRLTSSLVTYESRRSSGWRRERGERHRIHVDVSYTVRRRPISSRRARDAVIATLDAERVKDALISVALVGSKMMAQL